MVLCFAWYQDHKFARLMLGCHLKRAEYAEVGRIYLDLMLTNEILSRWQRRELGLTLHIDQVRFAILTGSLHRRVHRPLHCPLRQ